MRPELDHLRHLEQQLRPTPARYLPAQPPLPPDDEAQRLAYNALRLAGRRQLRHELSALHAQLYGPAAGRWVWVRQAANGLYQAFARWQRSQG